MGIEGVVSSDGGDFTEEDREEFSGVQKTTHASLSLAGLFGYCLGAIGAVGGYVADRPEIMLMSTPFFALGAYVRSLANQANNQTMEWFDSRRRQV